MLIPNQSDTQFSYTLPDGSTQTETRESNIVTTEILTYSFTKVKTSNKAFLQEGNTATQTVTLNNTSLINITDIFFKDNLSSGATYVLGSVVVNGVPQPSYDLNTGFALGNLAPNGVIVVSYDIRANNPLTQTPVTNYATISYTAENRNLSENTNVVELVILSNRLTVVKAVDKPVAIRGETLHYTSTVTNTGTLLKTNLIFTDPIPSGTTFVPGSVYIDGLQYVTYNPATGFPLANLPVAASTVVEFDVTVN